MKLLYSLLVDEILALFLADNVTSNRSSKNKERQLNSTTITMLLLLSLSLSNEQAAYSHIRLEYEVLWEKKKWIKRRSNWKPKTQSDESEIRMELPPPKPNQTEPNRFYGSSIFYT